VSFLKKAQQWDRKDKCGGKAVSAKLKSLTKNFIEKLRFSFPYISYTVKLSFTANTKNSL